MNTTQNATNPSTSPKPTYLTFLRFFAGLNLIIAMFAALAFVMFILGAMNRRSYEEPNFLGFIISLAFIFVGFLAYGLLNAIADIAENMLEVGNYVRHLKNRD